MDAVKLQKLYKKHHKKCTAHALYSMYFIVVILDNVRFSDNDN